MLLLAGTKKLIVNHSKFDLVFILEEQREIIDFVWELSEM